MFAEIDRDEKQEDMAPDFGNSKSNWGHVETFYQTWQSFRSQRTFGWCDKYNPNEAPDRRTRRFIERENKTHRQAGKKKYNQEVRDLVSYIRRRDPRVKARRQEILAKKERERAEAERKREERRMEQQRLREERMERERLEYERALECGEVEIIEETVWKCEWCNKTFRSEKSFAQHERSKKHKKRVAKLGGGKKKYKRKEKVVKMEDNIDDLLDEMIEMDLQEKVEDDKVVKDDDDEPEPEYVEVEEKEDEEEEVEPAEPSPPPPPKVGNAFSALMDSSSEEEEED